MGQDRSYTLTEEELKLLRALLTNCNVGAIFARTLVDLQEKFGVVFPPAKET